MAITDLFSKRRKRELGDMPDVYQYDTIPVPLRVQIVHMWRDAQGEVAHYAGRQIYRLAHGELCKEWGVFQLSADREPGVQLINYFLKANTLESLDIIQLTFQLIDGYIRSDRMHFHDAVLGPDDAISDLNARFKEHGVGYEYSGGRLIRIDSQLLHAEVVRPALSLLREKVFRAANDEFLNAHAHYRAGRYDAALNEALKAFESTLKIICAQKKWAYSQNDTAKRLLEIVFQRGLLDSFLQSHFSAFRTTLEAGVPTLRNKLSGHGKGEADHSVPPHVVAYALHLTAANILMLVSAAKP
jgi:hypothetical protein